MLTLYGQQDYGVERVFYFFFIMPINYNDVFRKNKFNSRIKLTNLGNSNPDDSDMRRLDIPACGTLQLKKNNEDK